MSRLDQSDLVSRVADLRRRLTELKTAQRVGAESIVFQIKLETLDFTRWFGIPAAPLPDLPYHVAGFAIYGITRPTFFDVSYRIYLDSPTAGNEIQPGHPDYPFILPDAHAFPFFEPFLEQFGYNFQWLIVPNSSSPHTYYFQPSVQTIEEVELVPNE